MSDPIENSLSKYGVCGLKNLGNTCYMNSSLQCLGNFKDLTQYFLSDNYLKDINKENPLGTKGKIARKYASLLKHLWYGTDESIIPWELKKTVEQFNNIFVGYAQHDAQEFLSFLLDKLHEDLNLIKKKPYVEALKEDNDDDTEKGRLSWINHLKRDNSIIVKLMGGQFKSKIICPQCSRISITYDPYFLVSLPIPLKENHQVADINADAGLNSNAGNNDDSMLQSSSSSFKWGGSNLISGWNTNNGARSAVPTSTSSDYIYDAVKNNPLSYASDVLPITFMDADTSKTPKKLNIEIVAPTSHLKVAEYKLELARILHKDPTNIYFSFLTFFERDNVKNENELTMNELYNKWRTKPKLYAIEISEDDLKLDSNQSICVDIQLTKKVPWNDENKTEFSVCRPIFIQKNYSTRQFYLKIYKNFKFLFDQMIPVNKFSYWSKLTIEQSFDKIFSTSGCNPFVVNVKTNTKGQVPCFFCGDDQCKNCEVICHSDSYIDKHYLSKIPSTDQVYTLSFEMLWNNFEDIPIIDKMDFSKISRILNAMEDFIPDNQNAAHQPADSSKINTPRPLPPTIPEIMEEEKDERKEILGNKDRDLNDNNYHSDVSYGTGYGGGAGGADYQIASDNNISPNHQIGDGSIPTKPLLAIEYKPANQNDNWNVQAGYYGDNQMNSSIKEDINLIECLKHFQTPEILTDQNEWYCSKCKEHQKAKKEWKIYKAPPTIILHLKRFKNEYSKIQNKIIFPVNDLDLSDFVINHELPMDYKLLEDNSYQDQVKKKIKTANNDDETFSNGIQLVNNDIKNCQDDPFPFINGNEEIGARYTENIIFPELQNTYKDNEIQFERDCKIESQVEDQAESKMEINKPLLYDLFAVSNHLGGNAGGGHYTAYCKNFISGKWYHLNDRIVTEVEEKDICTEDAYVLFYKRKEDNN